MQEKLTEHEQRGRWVMEARHYNPTATLECVAQNYPRSITILQSPATRETAFDVLINPCVRSVCSRSVAVGLIGIETLETVYSTMSSTFFCNPRMDLPVEPLASCARCQ